MHILICEDDIKQRAYMESVVKKYIVTIDNDMKLALSASDPTQILVYTKAHPDNRALYFLDIDLQHDKINGIDLGAEIRKIDPFAKIVFVTTHTELAHLAFKRKISALDYIVKENPENIRTRIHECIKEAYELYQHEKHEQMKYFKIDASGEAWNIPYDDILFFETHVTIRHKIILHTKTGKIEFRGFLGEIEELIPEFYRSHRSYLLNISKVSYIDKLAKEAVMLNGRRVHIAQKKMPELVRVLG